MENRKSMFGKWQNYAFCVNESALSASVCFEDKNRAVKSHIYVTALPFLIFDTSERSAIIFHLPICPKAKVRG